jgi:hypothetical protein
VRFLFRLPLHCFGSAKAGESQKQPQPPTPKPLGTTDVARDFNFACIPHAIDRNTKVAVQAVAVAVAVAVDLNPLLTLPKK